MIIINNSNKTYLCRMTISVIKTAIKEKKNKTRSHFNSNTMKAILFIYIWENSALMFSKQLLTSKSD